MCKSQVNFSPFKNRTTWLHPPKPGPRDALDERKACACSNVSASSFKFQGRYNLCHSHGYSDLISLISSSHIPHLVCALPLQVMRAWSKTPSLDLDWQHHCPESDLNISTPQFISAFSFNHNRDDVLPQRRDQGDFYAPVLFRTQHARVPHRPTQRRGRGTVHRWSLCDLCDGHGWYWRGAGDAWNRTGGIHNQISCDHLEAVPWRDGMRLEYKVLAFGFPLTELRSMPLLPPLSPRVSSPWRAHCLSSLRERYVLFHLTMDLWVSLLTTNQNIPSDIKWEPNTVPPQYTDHADQVIEKGTSLRLKILGVKPDVAAINAIGTIKEDYLG